MRSLVISVAAICIILGAWIVFIGYAENSIHYMTDTISNEALACVYNEDWVKAEESIGRVSAEWYQGRRVFSVFVNAHNIGEIESSIVMSKAYIRAEEKASSMAELSNLRELLFLLLENEMVTIENVM